MHTGPLAAEFWPKLLIHGSVYCAAAELGPWYTVWNLWKEMNKRIFEAEEAHPLTVLQLIKEEANLRFQACGTPVVS